MAIRDKRHHSRHPVPGKIKLHWHAPDGGSTYISAQCLDISKSGLRVKVERRVEPGLMVRIESAAFHIGGIAYVRHCRAQGLHFVAGIEFVGGLTWDEPRSE